MWGGRLRNPSCSTATGTVAQSNRLENSVKAYDRRSSLNAELWHRASSYPPFKRWEADRSLPRCHWHASWAPAGPGLQSCSTLTWQTASTGSPVPAPFLRQVSETYSSLNWKSVTYLNCFSDLIRIFHLQQAILKYCLYTNSHSE